ncbi:MAG TPA: phosphate-starvation-inducible PsiE family protein [Methylomirabilota bacterium]|nr:phosphate-starvation-inducible PsiE family protein [Methylomirabilota bacterium]
MKAAERQGFRERIARAFTGVEDAVYIVLAVMLAAVLLSLLVDTALTFARAIGSGLSGLNIIPVLDRALLVLMVVEILYTVQVSFREHVLIPEPFLLVALIAAVRRIIVLTAELGELARRGGDAFRGALIETALVAGVILALAAALVILRKRHPQAVAERS